MKVLAIDQSTSITGIAVGDSRDDMKGGYVFGVIKTPKDDFNVKLAHLFSELDRVIRQHRPELIAMEAPVLVLNHGKERQQFVPRAGFLAAEPSAAATRPAHAFNSEIMCKLQQVAGVILCLSGLHGIPIENVVASSWRKTALGMGRAPVGAPLGWFKKAMVTRAKQLGYAVRDDNEADALGILIHALHGPQAAKRAQGDLMKMVAL